MVFFGFKVFNEDDECSKLITKFNDNLNNKDDFVKYSWSGSVVGLGDYSYSVSMSTFYPKVYYIGFFLFFVVYLFTNKIFTYWNIISVILSLSIVLFSGYFYLIVLRLGLKKVGSKAKIKLLNNDFVVSKLHESIKECGSYGTGRSL